MQKKKTSLLMAPFLGLFAAAFIFSIAWAQDSSPAKKARGGEGVSSKNVQVDGSMEVNKIETPKTGKKEKNTKGQANAASHRSAVAAFVENLLSVAEREGGIGAEVREIAQAQNDSKEKVAKEIEVVQGRSKIKTFFLGTDYKNLGQLRSDMVKTGNQLEQLKRLVEKAENGDSKSRLEAQIQALTSEQNKIQKFITDNESRFSLFGWAVKLFQ